MANLNAIEAATSAEGGISLNELFYELKLTQRLRVFEDALQDIVILREVRAQGITVSDTELQKEADALRRSLSLLKAADTQRWLREQAMTEDDLENYLSRLLSSAKLKERLTAGKVEPFFASNRPNYDSARLCQIVVESADLAGQIVKQLKGGKADFDSLALEYSVDRATRERGGALGRVWRMHLPPEVAKAVFLANPGDVVGPIAVDGAFYVLRADDTRRAKLDEETTELVKDALFNAWLQEQTARSQIKLRLPGLIATPAA